MAEQAHARREKEKREAEERNWKQYLILPPLLPDIVFEGEEPGVGLSRIEPQSMVIFKEFSENINDNTFISEGGVSVRDLIKIKSKKEIQLKSHRLRHSVDDRARSTLLKDKAFNLSLRKV
jgi:hypothetical protein